MDSGITFAMILGAQMGTLLHAQERATQQLSDQMTGPLGRTELVATVSFGSAPVARDQTARRRVPPEVSTGAAIGAVTGLVAGVVIAARRDCEGLQCAAKAVALPLFIFAYTTAGGLAGAGVGLVVHLLKPAEHEEARFNSHPTQLGIGLAVSF